MLLRLVLLVMLVSVLGNFIGGYSSNSGFDLSHVTWFGLFGNELKCFLLLFIVNKPTFTTALECSRLAVLSFQKNTTRFVGGVISGEFPTEW